MLDWARSLGADEIDVQEPAPEALSAKAITLARSKLPRATTPPAVPEGGVPESAVFIMAMISRRETPGIVDYWHASWQDSTGERAEYDGERDQVIAWAKSTKAHIIWIYDLDAEDLVRLA